MNGMPRNFDQNPRRNHGEARIAAVRCETAGMLSFGCDLRPICSFGLSEALSNRQQDMVGWEEKVPAARASMRELSFAEIRAYHPSQLCTQRALWFRHRS